MTFTKEQKAGMFMKLADTTLYKVGLAYGLDKKYSNAIAVKGAVYRVYNEVKNNPEDFGIEIQTVDLVTKAVSSRSIAISDKPTIAERVDSKTIANDIKSLTLGGRDKLASIINTKLTQIERSPKAIREISLSQLGIMFGIMFDKSQIIQGQATEHVAMLAKIDKDIKPDEAINMVLKMREINNEEQIKKK